MRRTTQKPSKFAAGVRPRGPTSGYPCPVGLSGCAASAGRANGTASPCTSARAKEPLPSVVLRGVRRSQPGRGVFGL